MSVRIDAAGHQVLAAAVEYLTARGGIKVVANGLMSQYSCNCGIYTTGQSTNTSF